MKTRVVSVSELGYRRELLASGYIMNPRKRAEKVAAEWSEATDGLINKKSKGYRKLVDLLEDAISDAHTFGKAEGS